MLSGATYKDWLFIVFFVLL